MADKHFSGSDSSGPAGLAGVARKLARRTTDLLAIALILVAGLGLGRQVVDWWLTDPAEVLSHGARSADAAAGPLFGEGAGPLLLEFGAGSTLLRRETVRGTRREARSALVEFGRRAAESARRPDRPPSDAERRLWETVSERTPVAEDPGRWRVDLAEGPVPMMAATRRFGGSSAGEDGTQRNGGPRVVCWGLAFPAGPQRWAVYALQPSGADSRVSREHSAAVEIPLPPGSRQTLSVRSPSGGRLIGFEGAGPPKDWQQFWNDWFARHGGRTARPWTSSKTGWTASFRLAAGSEDIRAEISLARSGRGVWTGLLHVARLASDG